MSGRLHLFTRSLRRVSLCLRCSENLDADLSQACCAKHGHLVSEWHWQPLELQGVASIYRGMLSHRHLQCVLTELVQRTLLVLQLSPGRLPCQGTHYCSQGFWQLRMLSPKQAQLRHGLDVVNVEFHHCCFAGGAWSKRRACGARKACEGYLATSCLGDLLNEVFSDSFGLN